MQIFRICLATPLTGLLIAATLAAHAQSPNPVYFHSYPDAVTGDNSPRVVNHPNATCDPGKECYLPDPNPPSGAQWVDDYGRDIYERPTGGGRNADDYLAHLDITESAFGYDANYIYYRIDLFGLDNGQLSDLFAFEMNFDSDVQGDLLVYAKDPTNRNGTVWGTNEVKAYFDADNSVGGVSKLLPDGPGGTANGYETQVFDKGNNKLGGQPGGTNAIVARISPSDPTIIEFAVSRVFLQALTPGNPILRAAFRPIASKSDRDEKKFYLHDDLTRKKVGSPHPWLQMNGAPATCPDSLSAEQSLTSPQRAALSSGTNLPTAYLNPCYPEDSLKAYDNSGTLDDLASGSQLLFAVNLAIALNASANPVNVDASFAYNLTASNLTSGIGSASGVKIVTALPPSATFVSAVPSQGNCAFASGTVTCNLGTLANGASAAVQINVTAPPSPQTVSGSANISSNETESNATDNSAVYDVVVLGRAILSATKSVELPIDLPGSGYQTPSSDVVYRLSIANTGEGAVDANSIVIVDQLPPNVIFSTADLDPDVSRTSPVLFVDGTPASGLICCASGNVSFSSDPRGTTAPNFSYTPQPGYDPAVTFVRVAPTGQMVAASAGIPIVFDLLFRVRIR